MSEEIKQAEVSSPAPTPVEPKLHEYFEALNQLEENFEQIRQELIKTVIEAKNAVTSIKAVPETFDRLVGRFDKYMNVKDSMKGVELLELGEKVDALSKALDNTGCSLDALTKMYGKNLAPLMAIRKAISTRLGGEGIKAVKEDASVKEIPVEFTDEGFDKTLRGIERATNPFSVMQAACDGIRAVPDAKGSIGTKIAKMQERLKLATDKKSPEYQTAKTMLDNLMDKDEVINNRAKILIAKHGEAAKIALNRTLGFMEKVEDAVKSAGVAKVVKESVIDVSIVLDNIGKVNSRMKG